MKRLLILILMLCMPDIVPAQNYSTSLWTITEITISANRKLDTPFSVEAGAVFSHEKGKTMRVPAFYDGENTWRIRFCPPIAGQWNYVTYASESSMAGKKGVINVEENPDEKGPVSIDDRNPQKFTYADRKSVV